MMSAEARTHSFTLTRMFDATPEAVFRAWTDPAQLDWFFNPGFPVDTPTTVDLRVGGAWRQQMIIDQDTRYITGGIYKEIVPNRKLVFTWGATGGWPLIDPAYPDQAPLATILFKPNDGRTEMTFTLELPDRMKGEVVPEHMKSLMQSGWTGTIERLVTRLSS